MKKTLKKYLIPHKDNEGRPHLLREKSVLALASVIVLAFLLAFVQGFIITHTDLIATIFPSVLVDFANRDRVQAGLPKLTLNPTLAFSAQLKANDMAAKGYFAHNSPDGKTPWYWFTKSGYNFLYAGENLAVNFTESEDVDRAWMNSPTHRANILKTEFTEIGIALGTGYYNGQLTSFVVQHFGRPVPRFDTLPRAPAPTAALPAAPQPSAAGPAPTQPPAPRAVSGVEETAEPILETLRETETFIAVRNTAAAPPPAALSETAEPSGEAAGLAGYASFFEELLLSPRRTLGTIYLVLGGIIVLVLILMVGVEIGRHHPRHMLYGLLLLVLIVALFWLYRSVIFQEVLVI